MNINVNGINLFYEQTGKGRPMIFIHGNMADHHTFDTLVKPLEEVYCCYLIDSRNHGESSKNVAFDYEEMANDIYGFITQLKLKKPIIIGFSDGAIIGMILAYKYPDIIGKLLAAGGNLNPEGLKIKYQRLLVKICNEEENPFLKLMKDQPHITVKNLSKITCPTLVLAGQNDLIKRSETIMIHKGIQQSKLMIIKAHTHESYIYDTDYLKDIILEFAL